MKRTSIRTSIALLTVACAVACAGRVGLPAQDPSIREIELEILRLTNAYRHSRALPPLRETATLAGLAREHSNELARRRPKHVDHVGLRARFERASESLRLTSFSENVARMVQRRPRPGTWVVEAWVESAAHRKNIEGDYDLVGIGVFRRSDGSFFFTQIFGGTSTLPSPRESLPASPAK